MDVGFVLFAGLAVGGAVTAVTPPRPRLRAIGRLVALVGTTGLLVVHGAFEVAAGLVVAAAVVARRPETGTEPEPEPTRARLLVSILLVGAFLAALLIALSGAPWPARPPADPASPLAVLAVAAGPLLPASALAVITLGVVLATSRRRTS